MDSVNEILSDYNNRVEALEKRSSHLKALICHMQICDKGPFYCPRCHELWKAAGMLEQLYEEQASHNPPGDLNDE